MSYPGLEAGEVAPNSVVFNIASTLNNQNIQSALSLLNTWNPSDMAKQRAVLASYIASIDTELQGKKEILLRMIYVQHLEKDSFGTVNQWVPAILPQLQQQFAKVASNAEEQRLQLVQMGMNISPGKTPDQSVTTSTLQAREVLNRYTFTMNYYKEFSVFITDCASIMKEVNTQRESNSAILSKINKLTASTAQAIKNILDNRSKVDNKLAIISMCNAIISRLSVDGKTTQWLCEKSLDEAKVWLDGANIKVDSFLSPYAG